MKKNEEKIHQEFITDAAVMEICSWREKYILDHHWFAFVGVVWWFLRYGSTIKSETTLRTLELHADVVNFASTREEKPSENLLIPSFAASFSPPSSSSLSLPPSHPPSSSPLVSFLSGGKRLNEGNPTTSLFFQKTEDRREFNDLASSQKERERRAWASLSSDANRLVTLCVCMWAHVCVCVEGAANDVGGVSYSVWESSDFTWEVCVYASTLGSLMCRLVCLSMCVGGVLWLINRVASDYELMINQSSLITANHMPETELYTWCVSQLDLFFLDRLDSRLLSQHCFWYCL